MRLGTHQWSALTVGAAVLALTAAGTMITSGSIARAVAADSQGTAAASATPGCGKAPTLTNGTHSLSSGGQNRSYILKLPDNYDRNHPYRLIFGFHWLGGSAQDVSSGSMQQGWAYYGLQRLAANSAIFVAPQGLDSGWANTSGRDVTFTDNMVKQLEDDLCVDTSQVFSLGFSYGGGMSYALACARPKVFRAVAVYSGGVISGCSGGSEAIPYLAAHGINDSVLPISGARTMRDRFVKNNGCTAQNPPEPSSGSRAHIRTEYSGCRTGYPVVWLPFDGGHTPVPQDQSGSSNWVAEETWKFFSQFQGTTPTVTPTSPTTPTTSPTTPTTSPTTPTTSPTTGNCRVASKVISWNNGLTEEITITNTGTATVDGWTLGFTLPGGQTITSTWNASLSPSSGRVSARNVAHNATIARNASVSFGFQATHTGNADQATSFTLNGAECASA
jgi:poly(3-hydroxybutyrate) depolymerase